MNLIYAALLGFVAFKAFQMAYDGFTEKGIALSPDRRITGGGAKALGAFTLLVALLLTTLAIGMLA